MTTRLTIHVLFTLDCESIAIRIAKEGPRTWEQSARAIEGYANRLLRAGYPPTLFLAPQCAVEHTPLLEELAERGAELGLYVNPLQAESGSYRNFPGTLSPEAQRRLIDESAERFADAIGVRPRSFRPCKHSASDDTYRLLYELGFRQGSIAQPGFVLPRIGVDWEHVSHHPRYVDSANRERSGELPLLDVPVTTDPDQRHITNLPYELRIDAGTFEALHQPVIDRAIERMIEDAASFCALCFTSDNRPAYDNDDDKHSRTLEAILDYLEALRERYDLVPTTLAGAHDRFRAARHTLRAAQE
ncbi:polysaccharide deacetylase family protein [Roseiflexus castenholzii]|uniref:polysaccharide deacetylase family protein n=1 Tax=Roseiflexus castenholzii TaxID=120962 RepID=UPI003C7EA98F